MALPVTTIIAALAGLMLVGLGLLAGLRRNATRINLGTEGDDVLLKRVRAHGNFTEYTPIALILLALAEVAGTSATYLWIAGGLLLAGRALHAIGLIATISPARAAGMLMTFGAILYMIWLLLF